MIKNSGGGRQLAVLDKVTRKGLSEYVDTCMKAFSQKVKKQINEKRFPG